MKAALSDHDIATDVNNFFSYKKEASNWTYFDTDTPAKCKVYVGFISPNEDDLEPPEPGPEPSPEPNPSPTPSDNKAEKAYILPFGSDNTIIPDELEDPDDDDDTSNGRTDLYLIPMKNMNYKDKEYDTYA